ncbi:MAG: RagB/SusD family nutrient uptake outer membrane protein [Rikenellaceae bacterium]
MKKYIIFSLIAFLFSSCEALEPEIENLSDLESVEEQTLFAQGFLLNGYVYLTQPYGAVNDLATDDGVHNSTSNSYSSLATGSWSSTTNPTEVWSTSRGAIQYINLFFDVVEKVEWSSDPVVNAMFVDRQSGEAYALRALHMLLLLQRHGGWSDSGELLGVPIITEAETTDSEFNVPRASFQECINAIESDLDLAAELLPYDYATHSAADIPQKYKDIDPNVDLSDYERVFGPTTMGRISGKIAEGFRVRARLLAASPAFANGTNVSWDDVAEAAAAVLDDNGGLSGFDSTGNTWYCNTTQIDNLGAGVCPAEIMWRGNISSGYSYESNNYPPSIYGSGNVNPTQNLVDAFPMADGYPIDESSSYSVSSMYENRDPRLAQTVLYNGSVQGPFSTVIDTSTESATDDGINKRYQSSTRTGYYVRKGTRYDCNLDSSVSTTQKHYTAYMRFTEMYLAFAEAINEAAGPTDSSYGYSAYDIIKMIRERGGITGGDLYLESIKNDQSKMREMIRNERRIELCFENIRFWDLRRWLSDLTEVAQGVEISNGGTTYTIIDVEARNFKDYMYYGPIPNSEILKYSNLEQNKGW